jgi:uncharacterized membrane protein (UPF0127 family)
MKLRWFSGLLLAASLLLAGCPKTATPPPSAPPPAAPAIDPLYGHLLQAQPRLPTIKVVLGNRTGDTHEVTAEVARQPVEVATGMMFRTNMLDTEAMLFVFPGAAGRSFYMRNCIVPLSAAYISPRGEILQIIDMQPHDERGIPSSSEDVQFVLEVPQGWFTRHNIDVGGFVRTEKGSLKDTYFPKGAGAR